MQRARGHKTSGLSGLSHAQEIILGSGPGLGLYKISTKFRASQDWCIPDEVFQYGLNGTNEVSRKEGIMRGSGLIWTIVGILAIVALLIFIFSAL